MNQKERQFVAKVWKFYERHGRRSLPWRNTKNPYRILVSEIMLQQTQVERVIPKYRSFIKKFPTIHPLAKASLGDVLREWQGLGYNRRAKMLHICAQMIVNEYDGKFPRTHTELMKLSGVGHYTAGAIMAFAFENAESIIETNIRSVFLHHFFKDKTAVSDSEILKYITRTLERERVKEWYSALMDYGAYLKKEHRDLNSKSKHYVRQSPFKDSDRQIRGAIIKALTQKSLTRHALIKMMGTELLRVDEQIQKLMKEGMIQKNGQLYRIPI